jgi:hypothetical protein
MTDEIVKCFTKPVLFRTIVNKSEHLYRSSSFWNYVVNNRNTNKYKIWHVL